MNWSPVREALTGLGVMLSLIFVAFEIRANTEAVKGSTMQAISDQAASILLEAAAVPEVRSGIAKTRTGDMSTLTTDEEFALWLVYSAGLRVAENRFRQIDLGILEPEESISSGESFQYPFFAAFWEAVRSSYPDDFRAFVDTTLIPQVRDSIGWVNR